MSDLNLLPVHRITYLKELARSRSITRYLIVLLLIVFFEGALLLIPRTMIEQEYQRVLQDYERSYQLGRDAPAALAQATLKRLQKYQKALSSFSEQFSFDAVLIDLATVSPDGIRLTDVSLVASSQEFSIKAIAASRSDIPTFQKRLEELPYVTDLSLESNLNERTNIPLTITARIKDREQL